MSLFRLLLDLRTPFSFPSVLTGNVLIVRTNYHPNKSKAVLLDSAGIHHRAKYKYSSVIWVKARLEATITKAAPLSHTHPITLSPFRGSVLFSHSLVLSPLLFSEPFFAVLAVLQPLLPTSPILSTVQAASGDWPESHYKPLGKRLARMGGVHPDLGSLAWRLVSCGPLPTQLLWRSGLWEDNIGGSLKEGAGCREGTNRHFWSPVHLPLQSSCV